MVFGFFFLAISAFFAYDTFVSYSELNENKAKIDKIEEVQRGIRRDNDRIRQKIDRFSKDPKAAEKILRLKYKMLRKDQYKYIPEK